MVAVGRDQPVDLVVTARCLCMWTRDASGHVHRHATWSCPLHGRPPLLELALEPEEESA